LTRSLGETADFNYFYKGSYTFKFIHFTTYLLNVFHERWDWSLVYYHP